MPRTEEVPRDIFALDFELLYIYLALSLLQMPVFHCISTHCAPLVKWEQLHSAVSQ